MIDFMTRSRFIIIITIMCLINLNVTPALADVIVLRTGKKIHGHISERKKLALSTDDFINKSISIEGEELTTIPQTINISDIQYIVLEDDNNKRFFSVNHTSDSLNIKYSVLELDSHDKSEVTLNKKVKPWGLLVTLSGFGVFSFGFLNKFGGGGSKIYGNGPFYNIGSNSKTYTTLNYILMLTGGIMTIIGIYNLSSSDNSSNESSGVNMYWEQGRKTIGVTYSYNF